jgi:hypothetical protein
MAAVSDRGRPSRLVGRKGAIPVPPLGPERVFRYTRFPSQSDRACERKPSKMTTSIGSVNYRLGAGYALVTATLLALQEPFSALAARSLSSSYFVGFTQIALLSSVPLLIARRDSRQDFFALLGNIANIAKLAVLFLIGIAGLMLYNIGLSSAHPIITAAVTVHIPTARY